MRILAVSGYKNAELGIFQHDHPAVTYIKKALYQRIKVLAEFDLEWVIISGQLGTELWAAEVVYDLQEEFSHLKLGIFTPYLEQETNWSEKNKEIYEEILMLANHVDSITKKKYENPYQLRLKNQFLVEKSQGLLLFYDEEKEASPKFILEEAKKIANHRDYTIDMISFMDIQAIVEDEQNDW